MPKPFRASWSCLLRLETGAESHRHPLAENVSRARDPKEHWIIADKRRGSERLGRGQCLFTRKDFRNLWGQSPIAVSRTNFFFISPKPEASRPGRAAPSTVRSSCKARGRTGAQPCLSLTSQMRVGSQRLVEDPWSQPGLPASQLRERGPEKPTPQSDRAGPEQDPAWRPRPLHQRSLPGTSPSATMK